MQQMKKDQEEAVFSWRWAVVGLVAYLGLGAIFYIIF